MALVDNGTLTNASFVWRAGMTNWEPLAAVRAQLPAGTGERCAECGRGFPRTAMAQLDHAWICAECKPAFLQKLLQRVPTGNAAGVWRRRRELVVARHAALPDRCVKCNAAAHGVQLKRKLYWHHPALYLMILFPGLLIYAIVAIIVRKRATLQVGFCAAHRSLRRRDIYIGWLVAVLGIGCFFGAAATDWTGAFVGAGFGLLLGAVIWGMIRARVVTAKKIDEQHIYLTGACPEYLAELPEWTGA